MILDERTPKRRILAGIRNQLAEARDGDETARASIRAYSAQYRELLRRHTRMDDNVLFPMARQVLDEESSPQLLAQFSQGGFHLSRRNVEQNRAFTRLPWGGLPVNTHERKDGGGVREETGWQALPLRVGTGAANSSKQGLSPFNEDCPHLTGTVPVWVW